MAASPRTKQGPPVPARSIFYDEPAPPDVYRSITRLAQRWVYHALGFDGELLAVVRPDDHQTDAEVIASLRAMMRDEPPVRCCHLVNADTISAAGAVASHHRPLSLPRPPLALL